MAGITQEGLSTRLGVSRKTIQRWEHGEATPTAAVEAALLAWCAERGLYRAIPRGPFAGLELTPALLRASLAEARLATHPASTPAPAHSGTIPVPLNRFIGRQEQLRALRRLLKQSRLLTLTGPGGVGKTRLALELARQARPLYRDGVFWVELAALPDAASLISALANALGLRETGPVPLASLTMALRERELLIVLDSCTHLRADCASLATRLLGACPRLTLLATSRAPLDAAGETIWPVPPLELPPLAPQTPAAALQAESSRLFIDRARLVDPGLRLDAEAARAVAAICHRLGGLPLALELAAATVRVLRLPQLLARLEREEAGIGGSVQTVLRESVDLLPPPAQTLFAQLAVFEGSFTLDAIEAVVEADTPVLTLLEQLIAHALLVTRERAGVARYRLLAPVRQEAMTRLEASGLAEKTRQRHATYYREFVTRTMAMLRDRPAEAIPAIEPEYDNIRAALDWLRWRGKRATCLETAALLWRFWWVRGLLDEGRRYLEFALDERLPVNAIVRAGALNAAGVIARERGDYATAHHLLALALTLYRMHGNIRGAADAALDLGAVAWDQGDFAEARIRYEGSLAIYREQGHAWGVALALNNLALVYRDQGDYATAETLLQESAGQARMQGDREGIARALDNLGRVRRALGDLSGAQRLHEEALALQRALGDRRGLTHTLRSLALLACDRGDLQQARLLIAESLAIEQEAGNQRGLARSLAARARIAAFAGERASAMRDARESLMLRSRLGDRLGIAESLEQMGQFAASGGCAAQATRLFAAAAALRERIGAPLPPVDQPGYQRVHAALRKALGEDAFAHAWSTGWLLPVDQAIAEALALAA